MKTALLICTLVPMMVWVNGCITIRTDEDGLCWPAVYRPGDAMFQDMDAISRLGLEDNTGEVPIVADKES